MDWAWPDRQSFASVLFQNQTYSHRILTMQIIRHRVNSSRDLILTPVHYGVEIDIRSSGQDLIIHHDPFAEGELFEKWFAEFRHKTLILNVKEEGLEERLCALMDRRGITDYFFLDQSFPFLMKTVRKGIAQCAIRFSEYESLETVMSLRGKVRWVWVDCFSGEPPPRHSMREIKGAGFDVCLVSPELQGYDVRKIADFRHYYEDEGIVLDAVCTKRPDLWQ